MVIFLNVYSKSLLPQIMCTVVEHFFVFQLVLVKCSASAEPVGESSKKMKVKIAHCLHSHVLHVNFYLVSRRAASSIELAFSTCRVGLHLRVIDSCAKLNTSSRELNVGAEDEKVKLEHSVSLSLIVRTLIYLLQGIIKFG